MEAIRDVLDDLIASLEVQGLIAPEVSVNLRERLAAPTLDALTPWERAVRLMNEPRETGGESAKGSEREEGHRAP